MSPLYCWTPSAMQQGERIVIVRIALSYFFWQNSVVLNATLMTLSWFTWVHVRNTELNLSALLMYRKKPHPECTAYTRNMFQWLGVPGLGSRLSTYWHTKRPNKWRCCHHTSADLTPIPRVTWIKTEREGVRSEYSGAHKPGMLGLSCKATKCSDAGTGDLGVLTTHENITTPWRCRLNPTKEKIS